MSLPLSQSNAPELVVQYSIESSRSGRTEIYVGTTLEECVGFNENLIAVGKIGSFSYFGYQSWVVNLESIGRYCSIGQNVLIGAGPHPTDWLSTSTFFYRKSMWAGHNVVDSFYDANRISYEPGVKFGTIGNDVWIGSQSVVMMGVTIGDGAIIGANSTVTSDVPAYAIVAGSPAKVLRYRFSEEVISLLASLKWWELSPTKLTGVDVRDIGKSIAAIGEIRKADDFSYNPVSLVTTEKVIL